MPGPGQVRQLREELIALAHPNVGIVREGYAAFGRGHLDVLQKELFAPDIVWHYAGHSQIGGHFHGAEQVMDWLGRIFDLSDGTLTVDLHDVIGNDEHVVALIMVRASRNGIHLNDQGVQVFHLSDGKVTEVWTLPGDQATDDDFWG
jgi:uncharacterized protein